MKGQKPVFGNNGQRQILSTLQHDINLSNRACIFYINSKHQKNSTNASSNFPIPISCFHRRFTLKNSLRTIDNANNHVFWCRFLNKLES